ncbi:MAG: ectoine hydroxylase [Kofleriaceae bacterium]
MAPTHTTDVYHSRALPTWEIAERVDPVVWGSAAAAGPLSSAQVETYAERGFLVLPQLFSPAEISQLTAEATRVLDTADRTRDDVIIEPGSDTVRSVFRVHRDSAVMRRFVADIRVAGAARQLLGGDVYIHQSRVNFKAAFEGKAFPWHSDFETWHIEDGMPRMRALSASILLTPNTEHNGPLMVIPGSHRRYVRCIGETPTNHFRQSLRKQEYGVPDREALTALAGDGGYASCVGGPGTVVLFDCNLMHGSGGNITSLPRHNVFVVYNSVENRLVEPFGGRPARPQFLAERDELALAR